MQKWFLVFLLCMYGCPAPMAGSASAADVPPNQVQAITESTAELVNFEISPTGKVTPVVYCAGAFIRKSLVLTAFHCVQDSLEQNIDVRISTFEDESSRVSGTFSSKNWSYYRIIAVSPIKDLALLQAVDVNKSSPHQSFQFAFSSPVVGSSVVVCGHPAGMPYTFTRGIVSFAKRKFGSTYFLQHQAPVFYGNSGGPVVNLHGQLVGIVSWMRGSSHLAFSVHLDEIRSFFEDNGVVL